MNIARTVALLLLLTAFSAIAQPSAAGIVYGPKAAFNITAPKGWVVDPTAGLKERQPCVLYLKDATWDTADPLMYARIAGTDVEDSEAFAKAAIEDMKKRRPGFKSQRLEAGKTKSGLAYFINDYAATETYPRHERVAYIQLPKAVAYIVFSADEEAAFRKHQDALLEAAKSLFTMEVDYPGKPNKNE